MVESELGMIPERWKVGTFSDLFGLVNGFAFKSSTYKESGKYRIVTIKNVMDGKLNIQSSNRIEKTPANLKDEHKIDKGDLLMSLTGNVGRVCIAHFENILLNQRVAKIVPHKNSFNGYIYTLLRNENIRGSIISIAKGSAQQNLSTVELLKMKVVLPISLSDSILSILNYNNKKIMELFIENERLEQLRDTLLPKLLSGEIEIPYENEVTEDVPIS